MAPPVFNSNLGICVSPHALSRRISVQHRTVPIKGILKRMKLGKRHIEKNPVAFICVTFSVSCFVILFLTIFRLPEIPNNSKLRHKLKRATRIDEKIGEFGDVVIEMLPEDLPFTVFLPSERAFQQVLGLRMNESFVGDEGNDNTYAVLSQVLGFSAVPRMIYAADVPYGEEMDYDSLGGYNLYMSRDEDGMLLVNRVRSEVVDLQKKKNVLVHIMDGVIMDADFEQSVLPDYTEDDSG